MIPRRADIRLQPADATRLSYDLRGRDGVFICTVSRDKATAGLRAGIFELWRGRHGDYLRSQELSYPEQSRAQSRLTAAAGAPRGAVSEPVSNKRRPASGLVGSFRARRVQGLST